MALSQVDSRPQHLAFDGKVDLLPVCEKNRYERLCKQSGVVPFCCQTARLVSVEAREPKGNMSAKKCETAVEKFLSGYNCAQSILCAYGPDLGLDAETALKVATGLGGGMGGSGEVCGALTGGILALGLKYGRGGQDEKSVAQQAYKKTLALLGGFERVHGSRLCRTLLDGCDLRTPEGMQRFKEEDLHRKVCVRCVRTVADILEEMLPAPATKEGEQ